MAILSVNINKVALVRNSRGENVPNLVQFALDCEEFGAQGITVHPRPDQRHIRYDDVFELKEAISTELNVEGYPSPHFLEIVTQARPAQCTLVPDSPYALTSSSGWDTVGQKEFLKDIVARLHEHDIRVSIFLNPEPELVEHAADTGSDRIELYTGDYARLYAEDREAALHPHVETAKTARKFGLGLNAGHDLNLDNLNFYKSRVPDLLEVSIGHALICDALYFGIGNVISMYRRQLAI